MPQSPRVTMQVTNNSMQTSTPLLGVSYVAAITKKGPFFEPNEIIRSINRFKEVYGEELVPDGSASNIERALSMGSLLRVCRVGATNDGTVETLMATNGTLVPGKIDSTTKEIKPNPGKEWGLEITIENTKEESSLVFDFLVDTRAKGNPGINVDPRFGGNFSASYKIIREFVSGGRPKDTLVLETYSTIDSTLLNSQNLIDTSIVMSTINPNRQAHFANKTLVSVTPNNTSVNDILNVDSNSLRNFIDNNPLYHLTLIDDTVNQGMGIYTIEDVYNYIDSLNGKTGYNVNFEEQYLYGTVGEDGGDTSSQDWKLAIDIGLESDDYYEMFCSHLTQHVDLSDAFDVHNYAGSIVDKLQTFLYFIEITKDNRIYSDMVDFKNMVGVNSKMVAYFAAGLKLYSKGGILTDSDCLGSVIGLAAKKNTNFFPWLSMAGQNRGVVSDAHGPVAYNYGSDSTYDICNILAENNINLFLIKDTKNAGKATLLWHNFTSNLRTDSEQFLNVEYLVLYIKKTLKPILESYLEEPNTPQTWSKMYLEIQPILQYIQDNQGINAYSWEGDQWVTSLDDLQVNNIKDVKSGIYRAELVIDEVVSMQQIKLNITLDTIQQTTTVI